LIGVTKPVMPGPFCAMAIAIFPVEAGVAVADQAAIGFVATSQKVMPACGKQIGRSA